MYTAIILTEKYPWLQIQFATLWFLGFVIAAFYTAQEIFEIGRIRRLRKRSKWKD